MGDSRLHQLSALGQSVWIDYLSRDLLHSGELARMMDEDAVTGVTSNPTIFQKAISQGNAYDEQMRDLLEHEQDPKEIFIALAGRDIGEACDLMRKVWDEGKGLRGYVSLEVDPTLANATDGTIAEAKRLAALVDKPNLYIKIPATKPGLPAIEEMIASGQSINVTLIFSIERHREVMEAYIRGHRAADRGGRRPDTGRVGRELLRLARRHRGRQAARGSPRAAGQARGRERQARLPGLEGDLRERALGGARGAGRDQAVVPVGLDLDQEPGLPRRDVRRGLDRPRHREHDAAGDDRGLPGPRRGARHDRGGRRRGAEALRGRRGGRRLGRRRHPRARGGGRAEVLRLVRRAARRDQARSAASWSRA